MTVIIKAEPGDLLPTGIEQNGITQPRVDFSSNGVGSSGLPSGWSVTGNTLTVQLPQANTASLSDDEITNLFGQSGVSNLIIDLDADELASANGDALSSETTRLTQLASQSGFGEPQHTIDGYNESGLDLLKGSL